MDDTYLRCVIKREAALEVGASSHILLGLVLVVRLIFVLGESNAFQHAVEN
jgi:hypothetical protein